MKPEIIRETEQSWRANPEKAQGRPTVTARSDGSQAVIEAGGFTWRADLPAPLGGSNQAPSPTALLLSALAGCAAVFIRDTLGPQLGVAIDGVQAVARGQADSRGLLGMDGVSPRLTNVQLEIEIRSPEPPQKVQKVYDAWLQRCPIYLALVQATPVDVSLTVKPASGASG